MITKISPQQYWTLLLDYLRPQRGRVFWLALLLLGNIALQLANPQILRRFLDTALAGGEMATLTSLAIWFILIALVQQAMAIGVTYLGENVGWTATNLLRYDLARHCLRLDLSFHNEHTPGEMIERIDGDINALSQFFSQFVLQVLSSILLLAGVLVLLFLEAISIGVALTIFVVATLLVLNKMRDVAVPYWKQSREASANYFGFVEERLAGMEELRASGAKAYTMRRFFELLRSFWQTTVRARLMGFAMVNTAWVLFSVGTAVAFVLGARAYQTGALTLGAVYLIVHYTAMLAMPIQRILQEMEKFQQAGAGIARIQELLAIESKLAPPVGQSASLSPGPLSVTFEAVSFAYEAAEDEDAVPAYVLHDLSFHLPAGQVLGLLGRTGSGKTTITRLLTRLYDPALGCVQLDGVSVRQLELDELRRHVGVVTQNVQLFHATVRDNLTFFDTQLRDDEIIAIIHELGLTRWYDALPQGLDTVLAADGGGLSAGEAQLLAFTRVFLKDPGLIILDEASSRLDPATEQLIERAVERLLQDRTAIIIAHRLTTVQRADQIMILEQGEILEHDQRARLAANPESRFYQLLQTGLEEVLA